MVVISLKRISMDPRASRRSVWIVRESFLVIPTRSARRCASIHSSSPSWGYKRHESSSDPATIPIKSSLFRSRRHKTSSLGPSTSQVSISMSALLKRSRRPRMRSRDSSSSDMGSVIRLLPIFRSSISRIYSRLFCGYLMSSSSFSEGSRRYRSSSVVSA